MREAGAEIKRHVLRINVDVICDVMICLKHKHLLSDSVWYCDTSIAITLYLWKRELSPRERS